VAAKSRIQIDRYSAAGEQGVAVAFLHPATPSDGWKVSLAAKASWIRFNEVDFGPGGLKRMNVRAFSTAGGAVEIHLDRPDGPLLGRVKIGAGSDWQTIGAKARNIPHGIHALVVTSTGAHPVELDWLGFE
jgi:hypothetical protein